MRGEIRFDGKPVRIADPQAARALGIGVVHQECLVFDNLSSPKTCSSMRSRRAAGS